MKKISMLDLIKFCQSYSINKRIISQEDSIRIDMGLDGDDAHQFFWELYRKFGIEHRRIVHGDYFYHEDELRHPWWPFRKREERKVKNLTISELYDFLTSDDTDYFH